MNNISDMMASITVILKNNHLSELSLGYIAELSDPTYIIWWDNNGTPYEDPVIRVTIDDDGLSFEVDARDFGNTVTVQDCDIDRLEWWQSIHANILEVLQRDGRSRCPVCGKIIQDQQKYCSDTCQKYAMPQPTIQQVIELANKHIRELIFHIAQDDPQFQQALIKKYIIPIVFYGKENYPRT